MPHDRACGGGRYSVWSRLIPRLPDAKVWWFCGLLVTGIFILDRAIPLGVAAGVAYIGPVLVALRLRRLRAVFVVAAICSVLVIWDMVVSPPAAEQWKALLNRGLSVGAIWIAAWLGSSANRAAMMLRVLNAELEARVEERTRQTMRMSEAMHESEARLRAIVETASDAIIGADQGGGVIYWNPAAEAIFGYTAEEMTGQPLTRIMPERFRDAHTAGMRRLATTGHSRVIGQTLELAGLRKDGTEFPLELTLASWKSGAELFFTAIIRDATWRKQAEAVLKQEKDELQKMNQIMMGREARILELKQEVNDLLKELSKSRRYGA